MRGGGTREEGEEGIGERELSSERELGGHAGRWGRWAGERG